MIAELASPKNRLAGEKLAPGFFCEEALVPRPKFQPQVAETYQESLTYVWGNVPGYAVDTNSVASGDKPSTPYYTLAGVRSGQMHVLDKNLRSKTGEEMSETGKAAIRTDITQALALLMTSKTFATAYNTMLKETGIVINPVSYGGVWGTVDGNNVVFGTFAGVRNDGSIIYPAYVLAHELGHLFQPYDKINTSWNLNSVDIAHGDLMRSVKTPNTSEYYAYMFAQQVSKEIREATGANIGNAANYKDMGVYQREIGLIPSPPYRK